MIQDFQSIYDVYTIPRLTIYVFIEYRGTYTNIVSDLYE